MSTAEMPLSRTKITVPPLRAEILHRPRLLALFDDLLEKKLHVVAAPAGYGKTTLLVDFARQARLPVCWLSLDSLDKDPQRFCAYLIAAIARAFPKFGRQSKAALNSMVKFEEDSERFLSIFLNEMDRQIDEHFVLIIDDFQFVDIVPENRALLSQLIYRAGENCHVILASRRLPALPDITIMVARRQVGGVDLEQLTFRADEVRSLFDKDYSVSLTDSAVEELMLHTEGWITGLHLSSRGTAGNTMRGDLASRTAGVDVTAYFDEQVLAHLPAELRTFLLQTSLLEEFDIEICQAIFGPRDWKRLFRAVRQNNLFVLPVGPDGKWLRYHHLFQEFLESKIREEAPETVQDILARLAEFYKGREEWEKAYAIIHRTGDPDQLADLVELAGPFLQLNERLVTLRAWLNDLPARLFQERPTLLSLQGTVFCTAGEGGSALTVLNQAVKVFRDQADQPSLAQALVRRAAAYRLTGDYPSSLQDADEAMQLSKNEKKLQVIFTEAERFKGINLHLLGRLPEAAACQEDALKRYELMKDEKRAAWVRMELGMTHRAAGEYISARHEYEQALSEWKREENLSSQANVLNSLGVLNHHLGEYEKAVEAFESALALSKYIGLPWLEALVLASLGDVYADLDEYDAASQAYSDSVQLCQQINYQYLSNYLVLARLHLSRLQGSPDEIYQYLDAAGRLIENSQSNSECGQYYLERGILKLAESNSSSAITALQDALVHFENGRLAAETTCCRLWLAVAQSRSGELDGSRSSLQPILGIGQSDPSFFPLLQSVRQARPWLTELKKDVHVGQSLSVWLGQVDLFESRLPALRKRLRRLLTRVPIQAPHLAIQAFGKARVRANGKWVSSSQWKTASVRELFFYLLSASRPLSKEEIGDALWPEMDSGQLKLRFKNELYRLRKALGQEVVIFRNDVYHFNHHLDYEYDVENFSTHLAGSRDVKSLDEKISHLLQVTGLRTGPYLHDIDSTWALPERERLDRLCVEAWKQLAEAYHQQGDLPAGIKACQEALKIDSCREEFHRLAMQFYAELGDRMSVIWQYKTCRRTLHDELDVDPSHETEELYRRLIV